MMQVALATEDEVSEAVGRKLVSENPIFEETQIMLLRRNGFGYLRSRMDSWWQMAKHQVVIVLTDLDRQACPLVLLNDWLPTGRQSPENLLLRVAVREIESWLLADHKALKNLLGSRCQCPLRPDTLQDPKQHLLGLAQKAHRTVRNDLVAQNGAIARQGIGYNRRLVDWVQSEWSPERAAKLSPSLSRARNAIRAAAHRAMQA